MTKDRNAAIRRIVLRIEHRNRTIAIEAAERRRLFREAKRMGIDPAALREFIRERKTGRAASVRRQREVSNLRRLWR